ncbi:hypothetical protein H5410_051525 [Solanum commersonii]|uniref:Uncharacterized protein n=1 Tax=Solanum commersonii TaxID=4109 RepID=A0A9J5WYP4_SOLCO|nr:hypothetical protein H5410_051525 [Solanum commersonii]
MMIWQVQVKGKDAAFDSDEFAKELNNEASNARNSNLGDAPPSALLKMLGYAKLMKELVTKKRSMDFETIENKRKQRAQVAYERGKQLTKLRGKAEKAAKEKLGPQLAIIAPIKY